MAGLPEPLAILHGAAAAAAVAAGRARWLAGGPAAFALFRQDGAIRPAAELAADSPLVARRAGFAGLAGPGPWVMGILNVTPDSFSDGGRHFDVGAAIAAGRAMREAGADILDIGGESTRPGAVAVDPAEEQARILPVIRGLAAGGVAVSVDTRHAATMRAALEAGARIVNDISGLAHDPAAAATVAAFGVPVVLMHMRGTPQTMMEQARYDDVVAEVAAELSGRIAAAVAAGVERERIAIDPGIGFAKNHADNIALLDRLGALHALGCPILVGVSRKRFVGHLTGEAVPGRRDAGSLAAGLAALDRGAAILRVHDVAGTVQAVRVWRGLRNERE